jgi:hypothetical protein
MAGIAMRVCRERGGADRGRGVLVAIACVCSVAVVGQASAATLTPKFLAGSSATAGACRVPPRATLIAREPRRLLAWKEITPGAGKGASTTTVEACVPPNGNRHQIYRFSKSFDASTAIDDVDTAGYVIAFVVQETDKYGDFDQTIVGFDARSGQHDFNIDLGDDELSSYAIDKRGDIAWAEAAYDPQSGTATGPETLSLRGSGDTRILDYGTSIGTLAFAGGQLHWVANGEPMSAPVAHGATGATGATP